MRSGRRWGQKKQVPRLRKTADFLSPLRGSIVSGFLTHGLRRGLHSFAASRLVREGFASGGVGLLWMGESPVPTLVPSSCEFRLHAAVIPHELTILLTIEGEVAAPAVGYDQPYAEAAPGFQVLAAVGEDGAVGLADGDGIPTNLHG